MTAFALPWPTFVLLLSCAAQQPSCDSVAGRCSTDRAARTDLDSVSLLQSRGVQVEVADDIGTSGEDLESSLNEKLSRSRAVSQALLTCQRLVQGINAGWPMIVVLLLVLGVLLFCAAFGYGKLQSGQDPLETRVTSVLHPQKVGEDITHPSGDRGPQHTGTGKSPFLPQRSPTAPSSWGWRPTGGYMQAATSYMQGASAQLSPTSYPQAASGVPGPSPQDMPHDMPPPLVKSNLPLAREVDLLAAKSQVASAATAGGDIMLLAPNGALLMRSTVRKIEADFWLEVAMEVEGGSPSSMVRLTNKDAPKAPMFGPKPSTGPEIFGPDGSFYGVVEMGSAGSAQLVSSTTGHPVATIDGDMNSLQLVVRTKTGIELAQVTCRGASALGDINICVHSGTDLALIVSLVLSVLLSVQA